MSISPHAGIVDFGTFTPPATGLDGVQGEVPAPLAGQDTYVLTATGWAPGSAGGGVTSFNTRTGAVTLLSADVTDALTYTPVNPAAVGALTFTSTAPTLVAGRMWYDGTTGSWNLGMGGGNITQQIGEELFVYGKASAAITDSPLQIIYQTGTVGASGVITFGPTVAGITDGTLVIGVATEPLANNAFGRITCFGIVHGVTTNGAAYSETWADGDAIWYNPVTGNPTNVKPVAPNLKVQVGTVIKAGSGGSGTFSVEIAHGSVLGGTDSNVQIASPALNHLLVYNGTYWANRLMASADVTTALGYTPANKAGDTFTGKVTFATATTSSAGINIGAGSASPTAPVGGDVWLLSGALTWYDGAATHTAVDLTSAQVVTGAKTFRAARTDPRVVSAASASTLTPDISAADIYVFTALAAALTINAPTGTPLAGDKLMFRIKDNGTARAVTWTATAGGFRAVGVTLPTTTTATKITYVGCVYNADDALWDAIAVVTQA